LRRSPDERLPAAEAARLLYEAATGPSPHPTPPGSWRPTAGAANTAEGPTLLTRPRRGRALWIGLPAAVAVLGAGGFLVSNHWTGTAATPSPTPTGPALTPTAESSTPSTPTATPEPTPTRTTQPVPAGWRPFRSAQGRFGVAVPEGWRAVKHSTRDSITFKGPDSPGAMIVEWTVPDFAWTDPAKQWASLEKEIRAKGEFEGYSRIGIVSTTYLGRKAADWEFTRIRDGQRIHVINRGFRTADGRPYALYWETTDARWASDRRYFETFAKTFRPQ
ncbi:hypothetical protein ACWDX9_33515, partial [Nonomuraea sp. NPDC003201]